MLLKKLTAALLLIAMLCAGVLMAQAEIALPMYSESAQIFANLKINNGKAAANGRVEATPQKQVYIYVYLQRSENGKWQTVQVWNGNGKGVAFAGGTQTVASGYDYRVYAVGKVYSQEGKLLENVRQYSKTVHY